MGVIQKYVSVARDYDKFGVRILLLDCFANCGGHDTLANTTIYLKNDVHNLNIQKPVERKKFILE